MESNQCGVCEEDFDHFYKQRIMIPCGDTICLRCFDIFLQPQNQLECMKCGETSDITARFKQNIAELKQSIQTIVVFCDKHPTLLAEKYCIQHNVLICGTCAFETHNHPQFIKDTKNIEIQDFCDNAVGYLITLRDRITSLVDNLSTFKSKDRTLTSSFVMAAVKEAQDILTTSFLKTDQENQSIAFQTDNRGPQDQEEMKQPQNEFADYFSKQEQIKEPQNAVADDFPIQEQIKEPQSVIVDNIPEKEEIKEPQKAFAPIIPKSQEVKQIIKAIPQQKIIAKAVQDFEYDFDNYSRGMFKISQDEQILLKEWIGVGQALKFKLTYRGTRDGFNRQSYYNKCKGIAPTLILFKSDKNQVFGGFTSLTYDNEQPGVRQADPSAFIFSLNKKTKHSQFQNQDQAISGYCDGCIIQFGSSDIFISDNCDNNSNSCSNIGGTYKPAGQDKQGSNECKTYLSGCKEFRVIQIEAYECI